jgi:hypothetical protein
VERSIVVIGWRLLSKAVTLSVELARDGGRANSDLPKDSATPSAAGSYGKLSLVDAPAWAATVEARAMEIASRRITPGASHFTTTRL